MMKDGDIEIRISSDVAYENLLAEMYYQGRFIGLLSNEGASPQIEFPSSAKKPLIGESALTVLDLATFEKALGMAKEELVNFSRSS